ncbi:MAG: 2-C-methyl-D-erythritol 4-phosphate cytidylyltransferase [Verrucomicrobiota bacterium]
MNTAIIVAGGSSHRMGFDKLSAPLGDSTVLEHTLLAFDHCPDIAHIILVCDPVRWQSLDLSNFQTPLTHAPGGNERQHSVNNGLAALPPETRYVAIHDGARPLITPHAISQTLQNATTHQAASLAHPLTETLKRSSPDGFADEAISRENLWAMETPQCFQLDLIRSAYSKVATDQISVTDEVSAVQHLGKPVKLVSSQQPNPKVTYPGDLAIAQALLTTN